MHTAPRIATAIALSMLAACASAPANDAPTPVQPLVSARAGLERVLEVIATDSAASAGWELVSIDAESSAERVVVLMDLDVTGADESQVNLRFDHLMDTLRGLEGVRGVDLRSTRPIESTRLAVTGLSLVFEPCPALAYAGDGAAREIESSVRALAAQPDVRLGAVDIVRNRDIVRDRPIARLRIRAKQPSQGERVDRLQTFLDGVEREVRGACVVSVSLRPAWDTRSEPAPTPRRFQWDFEVERERGSQFPADA